MTAIDTIKSLPIEKKVFYGLVGATVIVGSIWVIRKIMEQKPRKKK